MAPVDSDFTIKITYEKGKGDPVRIFDAASALVRAFEEFDSAVIDSVDSKIVPSIVLEDIETGSIKIILKNFLERLDDSGLKTLDWRPLVGKYLVKAKYLALEWLENEEGSGRPSLNDLKDGFKKLSEETDINHLPDHPYVIDEKIIPALDKIQESKTKLDEGDGIFLESDDKSYKLNIQNTWKPSDYLYLRGEGEEKIEELKLILTVRKPDFIGDTQWQFRHGKNQLNAYVLDKVWLEGFHKRENIVLPHDALECNVRFTTTLSSVGEMLDQKIEVIKVLGIIKNTGKQIDLFD